MDINDLYYIRYRILKHVVESSQTCVTRVEDIKNSLTRVEHPKNCLRILSRNFQQLL